MVNVLVGTNLAKLNTNGVLLFISKNESQRLLELKFTGLCSPASPVITTKASNQDPIVELLQISDHQQIGKLKLKMLFNNITHERDETDCYFWSNALEQFWSDVPLTMTLQKMVVHFKAIELLRRRSQS